MGAHARSKALRRSYSTFINHVINGPTATVPPVLACRRSHFFTTTSLLSQCPVTNAIRLAGRPPASYRPTDGPIEFVINTIEKELSNRIYPPDDARTSALRRAGLVDVILRAVAIEIFWFCLCVCVCGVLSCVWWCARVCLLCVCMPVAYGHGTTVANWHLRLFIQGSRALSPCYRYVLGPTAQSRNPHPHPRGSLVRARLLAPKSAGRLI